MTDVIDWDKKFKPEYDYARSWLKAADSFEESWRPLVRKLFKMMTDEGLDPDGARALAELRSKATQRPSQFLIHKTVTEDHGLLAAVGAWTDNAGGTLAEEPKMRAAALKLLRHVYLLNRSGNRHVWVLSLPDEFTAWPSDEMFNRANTQIQARLLLRSQAEHFSAEQKKHLAHAAQHSLAWCQKTSIVLANAASAGTKGTAKNVDALNLVKRWFADPSVSLLELNRYVSKLAKGFRDITATLNKGHIVLTDWVPFRNAQNDTERNYRNAEAFTFASRGEGMDVVYIESSFFEHHAGNVLPPQKNWTRILVHELTHLVCGTTDVVNGDDRYAWYGIGPHAGYPGSQAITNADNWAFFCADCAHALTDAERAMALKII